MFTTTVRNPMQRTLGRWFTSSLSHAKDQLDPQQEASLKEQCFLIDQNDKVLGVSSKRDCHSVKPDGSLPLHRGFSVYLFNTAGDLLVQKRASEKITYPNCYTNSCCSHPIADVAGEDEEAQALGVKRAAQRRLNYELGIPIKSVPLDKLHYLTRIQYMDPGDGRWGENEIAYIMFLQGDMELKPNPNEISMVKYVPKDQIDALLSTLDGPLTPWFELILKYWLRLWWNNLDNLEQFDDHKKILNLGTRSR